MRISGMEKEKRKGRPGKWRIILAVLTVILASLCWLFSYTTIPGHSASDFSRFKTAEEVVAFLHEPFDLQVTTSEEILAFMAAYPLSGGSCYIQEVVHETVAEIIDCWVPTWFSIAGEQGYRIEFWITKEKLLEYIEADRYCNCI
jgi:hypothetical protein